MDLPVSTSTFVHLRRCVVCGLPIGALRMSVCRHDGVEVREFEYSTRSLPITDHVHDDSYQDLSYARPSDLHLEAGGPADQGGVRTDSQRSSASGSLLQQEEPSDDEWKIIPWSFSSLLQALEEHHQDLNGSGGFTG